MKSHKQKSSFLKEKGRPEEVKSLANLLKILKRSPPKEVGPARIIFWEYCKNYSLLWKSQGPKDKLEKENYPKGWSFAGGWARLTMV